MPSHKHKKKKKSHKNEKKHSVSRTDESIHKRKSSLSESDDSDRKSPTRSTYRHKRKKKNHKELKPFSTTENKAISWKVQSSDSDSDDSNERRLKSLVRKSYSNELQESLKQNFKMWAETCNEFSEDSAIELSARFSSVLEQKALRACMISDLYMRSMSSLVRQIKDCTSNAKLYIEGDILRKLKVRLPINKETQTNKEHKCIVLDVETQTELDSCLLADQPLSKSSASVLSQPVDEMVNILDSDCCESRITSSQHYEPVSDIVSNQECCNISSTSDIIHPASEINETKHVLSKIEEKMSSTFSQDKGLPTQESNLLDAKTSASINEYCRRNVVEDESLSCKNISNSKPNNLDSRLAELGLINFIDSVTENSPCEDSEKPKRSNWYAEEIAQSCNFTWGLMKLTTKHRERVLKKIKEIFGEENVELAELSEKNITICRKRIASVIVSELTPIYQSKRIASRYLFKYLAKKITKSIMDKNYAPDSRSIRSKVREYFSDGKVIMSESDCV